MNKRSSTVAVLLIHDGRSATRLTHLPFCLSFYSIVGLEITLEKLDDEWWRVGYWGALTLFTAIVLALRFYHCRKKPDNEASGGGALRETEAPVWRVFLDRGLLLRRAPRRPTARLEKYAIERRKTHPILEVDRKELMKRMTQRMDE